MDIKKYKHDLGFVFLLATLILTWYLGRCFHVDTAVIQESLKGYSLFVSGILYIVLYVVISFFIFFSKDVLWFMAAVLFGPSLSALFICIAETINAFILFYLARYLGKTYVEKSLGGKYKNLYEKLGRISFFWLFIFRAAPLIPYRFLDLACGLTNIRFRKYLAAVILGTPVKMFWVQHILYGVGKSVLDNPYALVEYFLNNKALLLFSLIYIILVVMVVLKINPAPSKYSPFKKKKA
jgi:uncharacterized membrane protein YdjX (TVP38/TMEM64 family)